MTLTTQDPVNLTWKSISNDVQAGPAQNSKTVECQWTYELLAVTEANIVIFNTLMKLNLATNDIKNFISKQVLSLIHI